MYHMHHMYGNGIFGLFIPILHMGLPILIIFFLFNRFDRGKESYLSNRPVDTLKKRYARGEISKEEFERIKSDIRS